MMLVGIVLYAIFASTSIASSQAGIILAFLVWAGKCILFRRFLFPYSPLNSPIFFFVGLSTLAAFLGSKVLFSLDGLRAHSFIMLVHDLGNQMSLVDSMIVLPNICLEKVDRSTMAASLEVMVPFLDNDLFNYVVRLPSRIKIPHGRKKWLLKSALSGIVPDKILYGPKKGFNVPFHDWMGASLRQLLFDHFSQFA